ncbi:MAG: CoA-binding protein [Clostridiales bacterium]|nr:CoA-binding protein [Clostridiales bacterium]
MRNMINEMLNKKKWAVVGATKNETKFGYQIFMMLKDYGYEVYPVNPMYDEIEGEKCYPSVKDLPVIVDCVDIVIPPDKSILTIDDVKASGIENIWFQLNTFNDEVIKKSNDSKLNTVYHHCIMVELRNR